MATLRTGNNNARRINRRRDAIAAMDFHQSQVERWMKSGTLHKLGDTGYMRRQRRMRNDIRRQLRNGTLPAELKLG